MTATQPALARVEAWLNERPRRADLCALGFLTLFWAFFFWRALTPSLGDQVSYPEGDFSGQFLAFGAYQARRLLAGEIPLWNPYNYAGHPFLADTQSAVFYPLRLITIFVSQFTGGWTYAALQAETLAHFWLGAVLTYTFVRTITGSSLAGVVSALSLAFGGYLTGYPPLQLAILEAGVWLPLALLGVYKASLAGASPRALPWLAVSALAVGLSLLAGHPQTTLFLLYVLAAYGIHRAAKAGIRWPVAAGALAAVAVLGFALAAVQVLPGLEYMQHTIRADLPYDELARGFSFSELATLVLPGVLTVWSPLYGGIAALILAVIAVWRRAEGALFWAIVLGAALLFSLGGGSALYELAYLIAPGVAWFRGQERAAYVAAYALAILAGLGVAAYRRGVPPRHLTRALGIAAGVGWLLAVEALVASRISPTDGLRALLNQSVFLAGVLSLAALIFARNGAVTRRGWWAPALISLLAFDLFAMNGRTNWESIPANDRTLYNEVVAEALAEESPPYRVDGRVGLSHGNYGTLLGIEDIRGISPLRLTALEGYLTRLPDFRIYELLDVGAVATDWQELERPSEIVAADEAAQPAVLIHRLTDPQPRAWMTYSVAVTADTNQALGWLSEPAFDPRTTVILKREPALALPAEAPTGATVEVASYAPERIALHVETPENGVLVVSEWDYPGWQASVDGEAAAIWNADAGLRALLLEAGEHDVVFVYKPISYRLGAIISAVALAAIAAGLSAAAWARRTDGTANDNASQEGRP